MVNIAICFPKEADIAFLTQEIEQCFSRRNIVLSILPCHNAEELMSHVFHGFSPDILIYPIHAGHGNFKRAALYLKKRHRSMISIILGNTSLLDPIEHTALQPIYELKSYARKNLWECAHKAYDLALKEPGTFIYYRRPEYVSTPLTNILYFASEGRQIHVVSTGENKSFYQKLDDVEESLKYKDCNFIRIHKSYLVNADYITRFDRTSITLTNGDSLRISNRFYYERIQNLLRPSSKTS